jgi:pyruvate dehydrogenase E2 component (dihydrolipoamide acetyltransferase)
LPDRRVQRVTLPKWGMSMTHGKVGAWLATEGQALLKGDDLVEVDTDKITGVMEAPFDGVLRRIVAGQGADLPVGATIALFAADGTPEEVLDQEAAEASAQLATGAVEDADATEVRTAVIGGRRLAFAVTGAGSGDPVVLVHGFGGDKNSWLFVSEPLAADFTVYAVDLPGHGESAKDVGDGSLPLLASSVLGLLEAEGAGRAHLVGHSLGAAVVTSLAATAPGRVASLTLVAPVGLGTEINADWLREFAAADSRRELKRLAAELFADERLITRQLAEDLAKYKRLDGVQVALQALLGTLLDGDRQAIDLTGQLSELAVPVSVIWGRADRITPPPVSGALPARVTLDLVDGAGHMVHMERPARVRAAVEAVSC